MTTTSTLEERVDRAMSTCTRCDHEDDLQRVAYRARIIAEATWHAEHPRTLPGHVWPDGRPYLPPTTPTH